jgi:hypothetical protein
LVVVPQSTDLDKNKSLDWQGALLLTPALIALALTEVQNWGLTSPSFIACLIISVLLLPLFIQRERKAGAPLLNPSLFGCTGFRYGVIAVFLSYALL